MKKITNIYLLLDCSKFMEGRPILKAQQMIIKYQRALSFTNANTKIHIIGFNDNGFSLNPYNQIFANGNPNIDIGLKQLYYLLAKNEHTGNLRTKSIFMLHTSGIAMTRWNNSLNLLWGKKEFALGHRYVITYGKADSISKRAFTAFADTEDKILPYFSDSRLCSLVESIAR